MRNLYDWGFRDASGIDYRCGHSDISPSHQHPNSGCTRTVSFDTRNRFYEVEPVTCADHSICDRLQGSPLQGSTVKNGTSAGRATMKNDVLRSFANAGPHAPSVDHVGSSVATAADARVLEPGGAIHFALCPDGLAQVKPAPAFHPSRRTGVRRYGSERVGSPGANGQSSGQEGCSRDAAIRRRMVREPCRPRDPVLRPHA